MKRLTGKEKEQKMLVFFMDAIFWLCAAKLASGIITYEQVGPEYSVDEIIELTISEPTIEPDYAKVYLKLTI